jgi:LasA protease
MENRLKLGIVVNLKTKSSDKHSFTLVVITLILISMLACSQGYITPADLTATAITGYQLKPITETPVSQSTSDDSQTSIQITDTIVPSLTPTPSEVVHTSKPSRTPENTKVPPILYYTQAGDTLFVIAKRFNVKPDEVTSPDPVDQISFLNPGQLLIIPNRLGDTSQDTQLIPDSEVVFSPSALDLDLPKFINSSGGYLISHKEYLSTGWSNGAQVIYRVAIENSINPRILLSLLEHQSHWVTGTPAGIGEVDYPLGYVEGNHQGLFKQLSWVVQQLSIGYYSWRAGLLTELTFTDGKKLKLSPKLNAGTVAIMYYYSTLYTEQKWNTMLYTPDGLPALHEQLFGNPWLRAQTVEPLFPPNLTQPKFELPFRIGRTWSYTGGPHSAWGPNGALAGLDFAPSAAENGCVASNDWVTAMAPGLVVRTGTGIVLVDLDGDGYEQTGWSVLYMHIATKERVSVGNWLSTDDIIGRPSCEGGLATGTHTHIARKYNGEWILADGPIPFNLGGWIAHAGVGPYLGSLTNGNQIAIACTCASAETLVTRPKTSGSDKK